jgi:hypothetical protein
LCIQSEKCLVGRIVGSIFPFHYEKGLKYIVWYSVHNTLEAGPTVRCRFKKESLKVAELFSFLCFTPLRFQE